MYRNGVISRSGTLLILLSLAMEEFQCGAQPFIEPNLVIVVEGDAAEVTCGPRPDIETPINLSIAIAPPGSDDFTPVDVDDVTIVDDDTFRRTFFVSGLMRNDNSSQFVCFLGSTPSAAVLVLVYYPPSITILTNTSVVEGNSVAIAFTVEAYPDPTTTEPTVSRMDGGLTPSFTVTESTVLFSNVMRNHAGTYVLSLNNAAGTGNVTFELDVLWFAQCPPAPSTVCVNTIDVTVVTVLLRRGEVTCLQCGSTPVAGTTWSFDNFPLDSMFGEVLANGQQVIYDPECGLEQTDIILIRCTPPGGSLSIAAGGVNVAVPPTVPPTVIVNEGEYLDIECDDSGSNVLFISSVRWTDPSGNEIAAASTLLIPAINRTSAGVYTCELTLVEGDPLSSSTTVIVQYIPDVFTSIESPHLSSVSQTLSLSCDYDAVPPPNITWLQIGSPLDLSDTRVTVTSTDTHSDLMLSELMSDEGGEYVCRATNVVGSTDVSITVVVQGSGCAAIRFIHNSPTLTLQTNGKYNLTYYFESSGGAYTCFVRDIDRCPQQEWEVDCQTQVAVFTDLDPGVHFVCGVQCQSLLGNTRTVRSIQRSFFTPAQPDDCIPYFINDGIKINSNSNGTANVIVEWSSSGSPSGFECRIDFGGRFHCEAPLSLDLEEGEQHHVIIQPVGCSGDANPLRRRFEVPVEGCALPFSHR